MKKGKIRYGYPGGNTCRGFYSFFALGLKNMERIFILKGGPGTGKSTLMRKIGLEMAERGFNVDFWQCFLLLHPLNDRIPFVLPPTF
jgi:DNA replication protein DnaC